MPGLSDLIAPVAPTALPAFSTPPSLTNPVNFAERADTHVAEVVAQVPLLNAENAKVSKTPTPPMWRPRSRCLRPRRPWRRETKPRATR